MRSKRRREGYLMIDHRFSPGVDAELIKASGLDAPIVGPGALFESATVRCCHCGTVVILNPDRSRERGHCKRCDHYVCDNPLCHRDCTPINKQIDEMLNQRSS